MDQTEKKIKDDGSAQAPGCNVNMTFNFVMGGLAVAAALLIGYLIFRFL